MHQLHGSSVTYRVAVGPRQGRKVFTLQTMPTSDPEEWVGKVDGFSLHAGVATKAHERKKLERICRYITRPPVSEQRLTTTRNGMVRYALKTPYRDGADIAEDKSPEERRASMNWAQRLKRVFDIDVETCDQCSGAVKAIACIEDAWQSKRYWIIWIVKPPNRNYYRKVEHRRESA